MASTSARLSPALRPWVRRCVGYDYRGLDPDAVHHGLPSTAVTVIFAFDEPLDCGWPGQPAEPRWVLVAGLHTRPAIVHTHGKQSGIQLSLSPLGARQLLGLPAAQLAGDRVRGEDLGHVFPAQLHERVHDASWPQRFAFVHEHLVALLAARALDTPSTGTAELDHAWRRIAQSGEAVRVAELAADLGWSRRHLTGRFRHEFGLTPKVTARVARFERAAALARVTPSLAEVAAACGYADQAHLNRDWRGFAGRAPRHTLTDLPIVQDAALR